MMNNPQVRMWAKGLAMRAGKDAKSPEEAIHRVYRISLSRDATAEELVDGLAFLKTQEASYKGKADAKDLALADYCQVVMCLNELVYVE